MFESALATLGKPVSALVVPFLNVQHGSVHHKRDLLKQGDASSVRRNAAVPKRSLKGGPVFWPAAIYEVGAINAEALPWLGRGVCGLVRKSPVPGSQK